MNIFAKTGQLLCMATIVTSMDLGAAASSSGSGSKSSLQDNLKKIAVLKGSSAHTSKRLDPSARLVFDPYGGRIASAHRGENYDDNPGVHVWDITSGEKADFSVSKVRADDSLTGIMMPSLEHPLESLVFLPSGKILAGKMRDNGLVALWDIEKGTKEETKTSFQGKNLGWGGGLAVSPDGKALSSGGALVNLGSGTVKKAPLFEGQRGLFRYDSSSCAAFNTNKSNVLAATAGSNIVLWDTELETRIGQLQGHSDSVRSFAWDPLGKTIVSCSKDKTIRFWDVDTQKEQAQGAFEWNFQGVEADDQAHPSLVLYSPDGTTVISCSKYGAQLWNAATKELITTLRHDQSDCVYENKDLCECNSVAISPDGTKIALLSSCGCITVWQVRSHTLQELCAKIIRNHGLDSSLLPQIVAQKFLLHKKPKETIETQEGSSCAIS